MPLLDLTAHRDAERVEVSWLGNLVGGARGGGAMVPFPSPGRPITVLLMWLGRRTMLASALSPLDLGDLLDPLLGVEEAATMSPIR